MSTHTPGPWTAVGRAIEADSPEREGFTDVVGWISDDYGERRADANARLIAAAPDMYDILKDLWANQANIFYADLYTAGFGLKIVAAIAKAEGREP